MRDKEPVNPEQGNEVDEAQLRREAVGKIKELHKEARSHAHHSDSRLDRRIDLVLPSSKGMGDRSTDVEFVASILEDPAIDPNGSFPELVGANPSNKKTINSSDPDNGRDIWEIQTDLGPYVALVEVAVYEDNGEAIGYQAYVKTPGLSKEDRETIGREQAT